ncbi:hypothetical protein BGZ93_003876 [Podila epicladia]|nr:hypothetical protein BGZ93_003876 [Podila epicladia]
MVVFQLSFTSTIDVKTPSVHPSAKRTFDWQLLPQEELDRVGYNSHKQRKARLKLKPPRCPQCPEARLTSEVMLVTHLISKKHLMRIQRLGESGPSSSANRESKNKASNDSTGAQDVIMKDTMNTVDEAQDKPDSVRSVPVRPLIENKPIDSVKIKKSRDSKKPENRKKTEEPEPSENTTKPDRSKKPRKKENRVLKKPEEPPKPKKPPKLEDLAKPGEGKLEVSKERESPIEAKESTTPSKEKSQKQMERTKTWRRLERSKKKGKRRDIKDKADIEDCSTTNTRMPSGASQSVVSTDISMDTELENDTGKKNDLASHSPKKREHKTTHRPSSNLNTLKHACGNNNFVAEAAASTKLLASNNSATSTKNEPISQWFWNCSLCGSVWKQEKAWVGHLTSGQHTRRVLKAVQQTSPEITPFNRQDILSANDPFGWGTSAGVVEEEDSENDEAIMEVDRQTIRDEEILEDDDDNMDLEE